MAERVAAGGLGKPRRADGFLDRPLDDRFVQVVAVTHACLAFAIEACRRKEPLPGPFLGSVGVFAHDGARQGRAAVPSPQVLLVEAEDLLEMRGEGLVGSL